MSAEKSPVFKTTGKVSIIFGLTLSDIGSYILIFFFGFQLPIVIMPRVVLVLVFSVAVTILRRKFSRYLNLRKLGLMSQWLIQAEHFQMEKDESEPFLIHANSQPNQ